MGICVCPTVQSRDPKMSCLSASEAKVKPKPSSLDSWLHWLLHLPVIITLILYFNVSIFSPKSYIKKKYNLYTSLSYYSLYPNLQLTVLCCTAKTKHALKANIFISLVYTTHFIPPFTKPWPFLNISITRYHSFDYYNGCRHLKKVPFGHPSFPTPLLTCHQIGTSYDIWPYYTMWVWITFLYVCHTKPASLVSLEHLPPSSNESNWNLYMYIEVNTRISRVCM